MKKAVQFLLYGFLIMYYVSNMTFSHALRSNGGASFGAATA